MKQRPSFQFYPQDFLSSFDVQTMSAEEVGCYCLLLFNCWVNGGKLPNEEQSLIQLCRGIKPTEKVIKKFYKKDNFIFNKRLDSEIKKQNNFSKEMSKAAKKRWNKQKKGSIPRHSLPNAKAMRKGMPRECSSSSTSSSTSSNKLIDKSINSGEPEKQSFGNEKINAMLIALKKVIQIDDFTDSQKWSRIYARHCLNLIEKITPDEFKRRLEVILQDPFKHNNCNSIKYVYNQIKGFIEPKQKTDDFIK